MRSIHRTTRAGVSWLAGACLAMLVGCGSLQRPWVSPRPPAADAIAITTPRAIVNDGSEIKYRLFEYSHSTAFDDLGVPVYEVLSGPTCSLPEVYSVPTPVEVSFHRSVLTARLTNGATYIRGTWPVPTTRRVRGTTISRPEGGQPGMVSMTVPRQYSGGILVHSQDKFDLVFIEPGTLDAGNPPLSQVEVTLRRADGSDQEPKVLLAGYYYMVREDPNDATRVVLEPASGVKWDLTGTSSQHDLVARAVHDAMRKASMSSGVPALANIPPLVP